MKRLTWALIHLLLLTSLFETGFSTRDTRPRPRKRLPIREKEMNICENDGKRSLYCYCDNNEPNNATDANCLILNELTDEDLARGYFSSQMYLQKLKFMVRMPNWLRQIPVPLFRGLIYLRVITFHDASIEEVKEYAFYNLSTITEINLSRNLITTLKMHSFENMKNLTTVYLDENRITEINRDTFVNLPSLKSLHLSVNNISTLHDKAFKHLTSLEELELFNNQIKVITADSFHGLRKLVRLDLRNNLIAMIGDRTFIEMPSLRELELDQNEIEYISDKALDGMKNLRKLRLGRNKLMTLEPDFLSGAPGVNFLDLRDNLMKTMTFDNIKPIVTNLYNSTSHFYLSGNELICDCKLAWIWGLRNETKNKKLRDSLQQLTCFLEYNNATQKNDNDVVEWKQQPNLGEYRTENLRDGDVQDAGDAYMGDDYEGPDEYEDSSSNSDSQPKVLTIEGKVHHERNLFDLKLEGLPCPEPSREDLMASEQPSSRHENARVGSSGSSWFSSSSRVRADLSVLSCSALLLLSVLFT